jgi:hypothetical protein
LHFYERLGFVHDKSHGVWDEEGINHVYVSIPLVG